MTEKEFKDIVRQMQPDLLFISRRITGDEEEAKDVVQDALLRLWQIDGEIRNIKAFARIVVRNMSLDIVRKRSPHLDIGDIENAVAEPPETTDERIERLMKVVQQLPTMQQTVLRMRHMEGMTMSDIAELVGTSEQAIRQSLSRARRAILASYSTQQKR